AQAAAANNTNNSRHRRSLNIRPYGYGARPNPSLSSLTHFQHVGNEFGNQTADLTSAAARSSVVCRKPVTCSTSPAASF
ncbi:MAG: hypothetical protein WBW06_25115, partial [Xanthobacteraceae bacterium]